MTPKARRSGNTDLAGTNIKVNRHASGTIYYSYILPNGRTKSLGKDKAAALEAAAVLNEQFSRRPDLIAKIRASIEPQTIVADDPPLSWLIREYREKRLALQRYSDRSRAEIEYKLAAYERHWGERRVQSIAVLDLATFLNARSGHAQKKHRHLLRELFQFACHQGFRVDNPAAATMEPIVPPKKRTRHSMEALDAILKTTPDTCSGPSILRCTASSGEET